MWKLAIALAASSLPVTAAAAPMPCGPRGDLVAKLAAEYRETPAAIALAADGNVVELLRAADGVTWNIIVTTPSGRSCLVAAGESWQNIEQMAHEGGDI